MISSAGYLKSAEIAEASNPGFKQNIHVTLHVAAVTMQKCKQQAFFHLPAYCVDLTQSN